MPLEKMDLKAINAVGRMDGVMPTKPLSDLTLNKKYAVSKIRKVHTKYGIRIVAELKNQFAVFLPGRIMKIFEDVKCDETFEKLEEAAASKKFYFCYLGGPYNLFEFKYVQ